MRVHISAKHYHLTLKNLGGHVTLATPLLEKFLGVMSGLSLGTLVPDLKSVALIVFELLAFRGPRDPSHAPIWIYFWGSCPDCPWEHLCQI